MHFGATLRLLRIDAGLSLRALAQRIGVSSAYLSRVENGHDSVPTPERLSAIARTFGLPAELLLELAHQAGPFVSRYMQTVPAANVLFLEIARRGLSGPQLARVKAFIDAEFGASVNGEGLRIETQPLLSALLSPGRVVLQLSCSDLEDVIDIAASRLAKSFPGASASALAEQLRRREDEASTAIGNGVAVPHALVGEALQTSTPGHKPVSVAALITLAQPLDAPTPDRLPLRLFVILVSAESGQAQLQLLAQVARLASQNFADELCALRDVQAVLAHLHKIESVCT